MAKALKTARRARQGGRVAKAGAPNAKRFVADRKKGELSFVADRQTRKPGQYPRNFWSVKPTGDDVADVALGRRFALEYLEMNSETTHETFLQWIVKDMPRSLTGVEIGFLTMVHYAARAGRSHARALSEHRNAAGPLKARKAA